MTLQTNALLDVEDVFDYMKKDLPVSTDPNYVLIESLINRASDFCETYINGPIINKSATIALDGDGSDELALPYYPIQSVSSVLVDGVDATDNIDFYPEGFIYYTTGDAFPKGRKNIQVTFTAGLGADKNAIPQDIKQAALLITHYWYKRDSLDYSQTYGESEVIVGQWRFPSIAAQMLDRYRRPNMAVI
ncbi:hypothetical protein H1164_03535 [Thermoactinomyces daqus]|uniref:Phage gp6-like head-tail connector protein n=1 Tax=Thermoactinomyces daqus TaxID=1329516 RepID=A0A7W1X8D8_9BACL|nr:hypothetical protein [Thermoactinomyces daqus]MBA4541975.1 hypothetical protein [Thermoactinomyces daqus]